MIDSCINVQKAQGRRDKNLLGGELTNKLRYSSTSRPIELSILAIKREN